MEFRNQDGDVQLPSASSSPPPPPFSLIYSPPPIRGSAFSKPVLPASSSLLSPKGGGGGGGARNGSANFGSSARVGNQDPAPISTLFPSAKSYSGEGSKASDEVAVRYKECLRNHAAAAGGHVLDGCGEFMPNGIDVLKCAACGCHRSFHRRDSDADQDDVGSHHRGGAHLPPPLLLPPPPPHYHHHRTAAYGGGGFPSPPLLPSRVVPVSSSGVMASGGTTTESSSEERVVGGAPTRKRFRTKFTAEQKEKMVAFAERIGWRLQRHEEALVEQFCAEAGIKRHVLKVWMHNNKHSIKKQQQQQQQQEQQLPPQEQLQLMAQEQ